MKENKHFTLLRLVSVLALVSLVSALPQEDTGDKKPKHSNGDKEQAVAGQETNVCRTEVCQGRAHLVNEYLDPNVDPCNDFYAYVCNKWIRNHTTNGSYDSFKMLRHQFFKILAHILESKEPAYGTEAVIDKPFVLYNSCMAFKTDEENKHILEIMNSSMFRDWPVTIQSSSKEVTFKNASEVLSKVGIKPLIQYYVSRSKINPNSHWITIFPLGITELPEQDIIKEAVQAIEPDFNETDLQNMIDGLQELRKQWVEAAKNGTAKASPPLVTIDELGKNFTRIPLYDFLREEFNKGNVHLEENETILLFNSLLYGTIDQFLETADPVALYNYIGFHSVLLWLSWSPSRVQDEQPRTEHCAYLVYTAMTEVVSRLYSEKYLPVTAKMEVENIVKKIKDAFAEAINNTKWMDDVAKGLAQQKLTHLEGKIGYPMWMFNTTVLQNLYTHVPALYPNMSFFYMMNLTFENKEVKTAEKLRQPFDKYMEWFYSQSPVTAHLNFLENAFVYPLGGLQPPFFEFGLPWSLNLGGIGTVIGHEITHAFARASPVYKYAMLHLMNNKKLKEFDETVACFEHQYSNITDNKTKIRLNGTTTLDENMADSSGLQIALNAYRKMLMDDCANTTTSLEGLPDISGMKLFFIGYGMSWCNAISEKALKNKVATDTHSPNMYRVNIPLLNLEAFATTFNCSRQSPMLKQSTHKCTLW